MRCKYCGTRFSTDATVAPFRAICPKCVRLVAPRFVLKQGDGETGFREVMIGQNAKDPGRKLLETRSYHFTIFVDEQEQIFGFDLTDRDEDHLLRWRRGRPPVFYGIANVGKGYHNRNEVYVNGSFSPAAVAAELESHGQNIRSEVRAVLLEGINAGQANE